MAAADDDNPVAAYKQILRDALEQRPAGIRRRLADVLGKNRSFITHLSNPVYSTPIPAPYVEPIFSVCHFSAAEREHFLAAYERAHPGRLARPAPHAPLRRIELALPDLQDPQLNNQLDRLLHDFGLRVAQMLQPLDNKDEGDPR
jgi:hypothetical protein